MFSTHLLLLSAMKPIKLPFYAKLTCILISIIISGYIAITFQKILAPLLFSFLFVILLSPLANFFERRLSFSRGLAALISVVLLIIFISSILFLLGSQLTLLINDWPLLKAQATFAFNELQHWIEATFRLQADQQINYLNQTTNRLLSTTASVVGYTLLALSSTVLFNTFILLFTFFLLLNRSLLVRFLLDVFNDEHADTVREIVGQVKYIIKRYVIGLFLQMAIVTSLTCIAFLLLGVKYAVLLGLITGIFNIIPYLGIFTALLISVMITFATAATGKVLMVILTIVLVHTLDGNVLMPMVVGGKAKINPFMVILGIIVGEMLWGVSGMFLSIPYIAIIKVICDRIKSFKPWGMLLGDEKVGR